MFLENIEIPNMQMSLATQANLDIFRDAIWDGVVGLGFTMDYEINLKGQSIIDRILEND